MKYFYLSFLTAICLLSGCAIVPNSVRTEVQHVSHATQHFGARSACAEPGNCGEEIIAVEAHWQKRGWFVDLSEGYSVERLDGLHEVFEGKVGYEFELRP